MQFSNGLQHIAAWARPGLGLTLTSLLVACGGGGGATESVDPVTPPAAEPAASTAADLKSALAVKVAGITLPAQPAAAAAAASLAGVDGNANGVRDDIEIVVHQSLFQPGGTTTITAAQYEQVLAIMRDFHPTQALRTLDHHALYCRYVALPDTVRTQLSMQSLEMLLTNTKARKQAYLSSLRNSAGSLGEENCSQ